MGRSGAGIHSFQGGDFHALDVVKGLPPVGSGEVEAVEQAVDGRVIEAGATVHTNPPLRAQALEHAPGTPVVGPDFGLFGEVLDREAEVVEFFFVGQAGVADPRCLGQFPSRPWMQASW